MYSIDFRVPYDNELYHHGVKGMKWGVRRYSRMYETPKGEMTKRKAKKYQKRLVEKSLIIGRQTNFANARVKNAAKKANKASERARLKPTDKNLLKAEKAKRVYEAQVKDSKEWNKAFQASVKEAKAQSNKVLKTYGKTRLKSIPEDAKTAGRRYSSKLNGYAFLFGALASGNKMSMDTKVAEYFKEQYNKR